MKSKRNNLVLIITVVIALVGSLVAGWWLYNSGPITVTRGLSLEYEGIEDGLNPDGTLFDYRDLISEEVVEATFDLSNMDYRDELILMFGVKPLIADNIITETIERREKGEDYTYHANEFVISISNAVYHTYSKEDLILLADNYSKAYDTYFRNHYKYPLFELDRLIGYYSYENYDYTEYARYFNNKFNILISYLKVLEEDDHTFVAASGESFSDVIEGLKLVRQLDLKPIHSYIDTYHLTDDVGIQIINYNYIINQLQLKKQKIEGAYSLSQELLDIIKANEKTVIIPGSNGDNVAISSMNDSYDAIAGKATSAQMDASDYDNQIAFFQNEVEALKASEYSPSQVSLAKKDVDLLVETLEVKLSDQVGEIEEMVDEYFEKKYEGSVKGSSAIGVNKPYGRSIYALFMVGVFCVILVLSLAIVKMKKNKTNGQDQGDQNHRRNNQKVSLEVG